MIIYNKEWLNNKNIVDLLKAAYFAGRINKEEFTKIKAAYPVGFYLPGMVVRTGLFILTLIIALVATGFISLIAAEARIIESAVYPIVLGLICYGFLEFFVKEKHYLHSGVDNALLYFSASLIGGGIIWKISYMEIVQIDSILSATVIFILCTILTLRFADVITATCACISFFAFIYFSWAKTGPFGLATMPFIMMIVAGGSYFYFNRISSSAQPVYSTCITYIKIISLVTLYGAGNYFVVNNLNNEAHGLDDNHTTVPLGFIFWIWTILLPIAYILFGIKKKNTMLLRLGVILVAFSVATFRNYYHLLPIEAMLTLAGIILLAGAYTLIKYLKTPRHGFTYAEPENTNTTDSLNLEGLAIGQAASHLPPAPQIPVTRFGGGSGGGGGSSDSF